MGLFSGCLLVSDIDDTLLRNGVICDKNIEAIKYFEDNGGYFTVATGRGIGAFDKEYKDSLANAPAIGIHGGTVYDLHNDVPLYLNSLDETDKKTVLEVAKAFPQSGFEVFCEGRMNVCRKSRDINWHVNYQHVNATYLPVEEIMGRAWSKVVFSTEVYTPEKMLEYVKDMSTGKGAFKKTSASPDVKLFELYPKDNKKSAAMYFLADHLGIEHDKVFSIGDYYNDLDMIESAKVSAAVDGSPKEIVDAAKYVTKASCEEGAVAEFIYYLKGLINEGKI